MRRSSLICFCRVGLVWAVVVLLFVDTAMACRWLQSWRSRRVVRDCCASSCAPAEPGWGKAAQKDSAMQKSDEDWKDSSEGVVPEPPAMDEEETPEPPAMDEEETPEPPAEEPKPEPAPVDEPQEKPEAPAEPEPAPESEPAPEAKPAPEAEPAPEVTPEPASPAEPEAPAEPAEEPAVPPPPAPEEPATPADEPAVPAEEPAMPAEEAKSDPLDDLFDGLPGKPEAGAAPAAPEAGQMPAEPAPAAEPPAAEPSIDDLFGPAPEKPAAEPAVPAEPAADAAVDDLFGPAKPADAPKAKKATEDLDDLFGPAKPEAQPAPAADPFGLDQTQELPLRTWVDNTGKYQVQARLIAVTSSAVQLLKETGSTSTVPFQRLSEADRNYVEQAVAQLAPSRVGQLASR